MRILTLILFSVFICFCTRNIEVTGGGVQTTNGGISYQDGSPAEGVTVTVLSQNFLTGSPASDSISKLTTSTDSEGQFSLTDLPIGEYMMEASDNSGFSVAHRFIIEVEESSTQIPHLTLLPNEQISGEVNNANESIDVSIKVYGLDRETTVDQNNQFSIEVPEGDYKLQLSFSDSNITPVDIDSVVTNIVPLVNIVITIDTILDSSEPVHVDSIIHIDIKPYSTWNFSKRIILNTSSTGADSKNKVYDFPALIRLDNSFDFDEFSEDGSDIRFSNSKLDSLPFTIEHWDPNSSSASIWVLLDTILPNNNSQYITMHWGKMESSFSNYSYDVFSTLNGFVGVYPLDSVASTIYTVIDLTDNDLRGTSQGKMQDSNIIHGIIGNGLHFDGLDDEINLQEFVFTNSLTVSLWAYSNSTATEYKHIIGDFPAWYISSDHNVNSIRLALNNGSETWIVFDTSTILGTDWHYYTGVYDGDTMYTYVDGKLRNKTAFTGTLTNKDYNGFTTIGGTMWADEPGKLETRHQWWGGIDHLRLSQIPRDPEWIKLCFETQKPGTNWIRFSE